MRSDMHKIICEQPRHGGRYGKCGRRAHTPLDALPQKEGIRRPYLDRKSFGEHLGPLRRWMRSQLGPAEKLVELIINFPDHLWHNRQDSILRRRQRAGEFGTSLRETQSAFLRFAPGHEPPAFRQHLS